MQVRRVLVVDDDAIVRSVLAKLLERLGFEVDGAGSGAEAIERFGAARGGYAAVVLDVRMPGMSGLECLAALQAIDPVVRVLIATGMGNDASTEALLRAGARGYLRKPFRLSDLKDALASVLETKPGST